MSVGLEYFLYRQDFRSGNNRDENSMKVFKYRNRLMGIMMDSDAI
jgi:hypothetical protein